MKAFANPVVEKFVVAGVVLSAATVVCASCRHFAARKHHPAVVDAVGNLLHRSKESLALAKRTTAANLRLERLLRAKANLSVAMLLASESEFPIPLRRTYNIDGDEMVAEISSLMQDLPSAATSTATHPPNAANLVSVKPPPPSLSSDEHENDQPPPQHQQKQPPRQDHQRQRHHDYAPIKPTTKKHGIRQIV
jgi:hypothetical protein